MPADKGQVNGVRRENRDRAVVFLHGFTGSRDDTWDQFPALLAGALPGWDIFTLGYATTLLPDVVGIWSADPDVPILATKFRTELAIRPLESYTSLALIAHSMGGLVAQRAIADEPALATRIRHLILFGTPSGGLRKASWLRFWKRQLGNMAHDSEFITTLRRDWDGRFVPPPFNFLVVAGASDQFVTPDSSLQPFDRRFHCVVEGNHLSIVKPANAEVDSLRLVLSALSRTVPVPAQTMTPLTLVAERPSADAAQVVAAREGALAPMSEREVVQAALALERAGERGLATALLERHQHVGTDVLGTLAGRMKRVWFETEQPQHALRAFDLYQSALERATKNFEVAPDDAKRRQVSEQIYYHAINLAFLELVFQNRPERARAFADLAVRHASAVPESAWSVATVAEARLYHNDREGALEGYRRMLEVGGEPWQFASAGLQAGRVAAKLNDRVLADELDKLFTPGAAEARRLS